MCLRRDGLLCAKVTKNVRVLKLASLNIYVMKLVFLFATQGTEHTNVR